MKTKTVKIKNASPIVQKTELPAIFLSVGGQILKQGTKFCLVGFAEMPPVRANGSTYPALVIELENGSQVGMTKNFFEGIYRVGKEENGQIVTQIERIDTEMSTSGLDIWDWAEKNKETTFVVSEPIEYLSQPFDNAGNLLQTLRPRKFNTYKTFVPAE